MHFLPTPKKSSMYEAGTEGMTPRLISLVFGLTVVPVHWKS